MLLNVGADVTLAVPPPFPLSCGCSLRRGDEGVSIAGTGFAGPPARALTPPVAAGDAVQIPPSDPEQIPAPEPGEPVFLNG